ncbi:hypothetical protein P7K49_032231 [Saguinus oedipus]|uniref:Small ribosomal subunit protein uS7 domain-containing protein n=1 Tax=Saguinus oedipus TaxID=9490 RepID=A0ABQ9TYI4_SAGOE|nr:hypothetical protein P7K49_032231 [Saguinus oedipus]
MHGHSNGKKLVTVRIIKHAFDFIHLLTGEDSLQVLVNAIALVEAAFRNMKTTAECLAEELISATKSSSDSYGIKKDKLECVAKSNR